MRLDSLRRVRLALEMGDSSVLHNAIPAAPDAPKLDINVEKTKNMPAPIKDTLPAEESRQSLRP